MHDGSTTIHKCFVTLRCADFQLFHCGDYDDDDVDLRVMVDHALRDIDRFKRQKVRDLKDVFINYAILQTEKYKKVGHGKSIVCHFA